MAGIYSIDSSDVNSRVDWRIDFAPGPLAADVEESFPGDPNIYAAVGVETPPIVAISGFLEAANHSALFTLLETYAALRADVSGTHSITFKGKTYSGLRLKDFRPTGRIQSAHTLGKFSNNVYLRLPVRFLWRKLTAL